MASVMRARIGVVLAALLFLAGCGEQTTDALKSALRGYFREMNAEAAGRRDDVDVRGEGLVISVYTFNPNGFIVVGIPCTRCGAEQDIVNYDGTKDVACARCGEKLLAKDMKQADIEARKIKVLPMFKATSETPPIKAEVRYVRREYYWDATGRVELESQEAPEIKTQRAKVRQDLQQISTKVSADVAAVKDFAEGLPDDPGMHRHLATFIGRMEVELHNADVIVTDAPREEPLRNWLFALNPYRPLK